MLRRLKLSLHALFLNLRSMLIFQIGYSTLFTLIQYSLFQFLLGLALRLDGYSYLNSTNMWKFLITPPAITMIAILFLTACLLTYIDACILLGGFQASMAGQKLHAKDMLKHGLYRCFKVFRFKHLYFSLTLLAYQTVTSVFFLYEICFRINPYSTFLPQLFSKIQYIIPMAAAFVLLAAFSLQRFFSICFWYLSRLPFRESKKAASRLMKTHFFTTLGYVLLVNIFVIVLWAVLRFLCQVFIVLAVNMFAPDDLKVAMVLSFNNHLSIGMIWFSSCLGVFFNMAMMVRLFYKFSKEYVILNFRLEYPPSTPLGRRIRLIAAVLCATAIIGFLYHGLYNGALLAERPLTPVQIYCHRGLSSEAPENTLDAVQLAIDSLSDGVEIDVQETKDGVVVVSHDTSLLRTAGVDVNIAEHTYDELLQYNVAAYFDSDYPFTTLPTLEDVMKLVKGRAHLLIELKRNSASLDLAERVVELISEYDMTYQCSVQSADYAYLRQINELNTDIRIGYILTAAIGNYYKNDMIDFFCVRSMFINETTISGAHEQGKAIYAWTINTRAETERMKNIQADVIVTDYPAKVREVIYREQGSWSIINLLRLLL